MIQLWRNTKGQDRKCILDLVSRSRGLSRATRGAPQYKERDNSSSSDIDTKEYRVEPSTRKRKSTNRDSDGGSSDDEQEIEEEQIVPPAQH
jgi:hypothetical protein